MTTQKLHPETVYTVGGKNVRNWCAYCTQPVHSQEELLWGSLVHLDKFYIIHKTCVVKFAQARHELIA